MSTASSFAILALAVLPACSSLETEFDYDTRHDFSGKRTYAWIEKQDNSLQMKRVREAVDHTLGARGFTKTESKPDFQVAAHVSNQDKLRIVDWGYTYYPHGYWNYGHDIDVWQYEEGTIVLDVIDPDQSALVWRGTASKPVDSDWTPEEREAEVREAVETLLAQFPPQR